MAHGMGQCKVSVMIPFDPTEPWSGSLIDSEPDIGVELMAHITLTSLCEDHLASTVALPITLHPVWDQGTLYGSSILWPCPTSRALTSTPR
jgi:hypothetical protein